MASVQGKLPGKPATLHNGKASHPNGSAEDGASDGIKESSSSRKERRKEWWNNKKKPKQENSNPGKVEAKAAHTPPTSREKGPSEGSENETEEQTTKLRNRETIAKPDSLKYEPNYNRGFHSKIMQNLYTDTSKKKKKKEKAKLESPPNKRKSTSGSPQENSKKTKVTEEPEIFDSYKFSMNLINGEVDTSQPAGGKDSKDKYVLFIGNLPYDITREQLEEHFRKTGGIKSIRIPREKGTDKGRGFAYMEFDGRISHGIALRLHQTTLGGRKINVEFTSIGGGKSEARKEKLKQKNKKRRRMKMH